MPVRSGRCHHFGRSRSANLFPRSRDTSQVGGKAYGVVARIITELTPDGEQTAVYKAGVKRQMAAVSIMVDGEIFEVQVIHAYIMYIF